MKHRMTSWMAMGLCVLMLAACGSSARGSSRSTPPPASKSPTALSSAGTVSVTITGLGVSSSYAYGMVADDTAVWVHNGDTASLLRIDIKTNKIVATIPVGHGNGEVAIGQGAVWVANPTDGTISRVDPQTNRVVATITLDPQDVVQDIAVSPSAVWVTDFSNNSLIRIDPQTNHIAAKLSNYPGIVAISFAGGSVWACNHHSDLQGLTRLDPQTNQAQAQINPAKDQGFCAGVVALPQAVWTMTFVNGDTQSTRVERIDPAANTVSSTIPQPGLVPGQLAADAQGTWVISDTGLYRIDPVTNRLVGQLPMQDLSAVAVGGGSVWAAKSDGTLLRITPAA